jgi:hypothetical protein
MLAMSIYATCHERGHSGAVLSASDIIVSINLLRAAAVTSCLADNRYGGRPRWGCYERTGSAERRIRIRLVMDLGGGGGTQNVPIWEREPLVDSWRAPSGPASARTDCI